MSFIMSTGLIEKFNQGWGWFKQLPITPRVLGFLLAWPLLLGLFIFNKVKNPVLKVTSLVLILLFLQIPWFSSLASIAGFEQSKTSTQGTKIDSENSPQQAAQPEEEPVTPTVKISYGAVTTSCSGYNMAGTLVVTNNGNTRISGRAEIPVKTYEKFMVPLSGIFLNLPPDSSTVISLEGGEGCKKGQIVGTPETVFTIPNENNMETFNHLDAFEWSAVSAVCDSASGFVRLKATARNTSQYLLTAGIQAHLANGPLSQGEIDAGFKGTSYFGTIYKLPAGASAEIDFGYGGHCIKGRKGFDGPYITEFETRFTY
jgi:hypothetical protein